MEANSQSLSKNEETTSSVEFCQFEVNHLVIPSQYMVDEKLIVMLPNGINYEHRKLHIILGKQGVGRGLLASPDFEHEEDGSFIKISNSRVAKTDKKSNNSSVINQNFTIVDTAGHLDIFAVR